MNKKLSEKEIKMVGKLAAEIKREASDKLSLEENMRISPLILRNSIFFCEERETTGKFLPLRPEIISGFRRIFHRRLPGCY